MLAADDRRAAKYAKSDTDRLALRAARLGQIEQELDARGALGMSEKTRLQADRIRAEAHLKRIETEKELSAAMRGTTATASAVIPAQSARYVERAGHP